MNNLFGEITELGFGDALLILLIGMAMIFLVLTLLVGYLYLGKYVIGSIEKKSKAKEAQKKQLPEHKQGAEASDEDDDEVVAAITAAITAILIEEANAGEADVVAPFKIKKIKHIR